MTEPLYTYRAADGIWRDRCAAHIKRSGPYRAVTEPIASNATICVECRPWGGPELYTQHVTRNTETDHDQRNP